MSKRTQHLDFPKVPFSSMRVGHRYSNGGHFSGVGSGQRVIVLFNACQNGYPL